MGIQATHVSPTQHMVWTGSSRINYHRIVQLIIHIYIYYCLKNTYSSVHTHIHSLCITQAEYKCEFVWKQKTKKELEINIINICTLCTFVRQTIFVPCTKMYARCCLAKRETPYLCPTWNIRINIINMQTQFRVPRRWCFTNYNSSITQSHRIVT